MAVLREEFRRWAEHGCRLYGNDPWFFLRELAQNSRDAGARTIRVAAGREADREVLSFEDDGTGMGFEHARRYLFRLYASSKESDERSAGKYGIGFWSVLRFSPRRILVESRTRWERWAILVGEDLTLERVACTLERRGTRVTLEREASFSGQETFQAAVGDALDRFCRYLRRNDRTFSKLPVLYNDRNLTRSMRLPGPVSLSFKRGSVEGAVGLSERPAVRLHARGLPVWKGVLLDELSHTAEREPMTGEIAEGLAPVFLLNGNDLNVVMSRRAVIDDGALARVRRRARASLARLVRLHMERTFPRPWPSRLLDRAADLWRTGRVKPAWLVLTVALAVLATLVATRVPRWTRTPGAPSVSVLPGTYGGAVVEDPSRRTVVDLEYEPPVRVWLKTLTAEAYDPSRGFVADDALHGPAPAYTCAEGCLSVRVRLDDGGRTTLPAPGGFLVDPESIVFQGRAAGPALRSMAGDTYVTLPPEAGTLSYTCGPSPVTEEGDPESLSRLTEVPDMPLPPRVLEALDRASGKEMQARLIAALVSTRVLVEYDGSARTARAYAGVQDAAGWLPFVLQVGRGDCDVLNAVNVLMLRRMGVPARLAIGVVGHDGRAGPELHAWTEYHDGKWRVIDATPAVETAASPSPSAPGVRERILGPVPPALSVPVGADRQAPAASVTTPEQVPGHDRRLATSIRRIPPAALASLLVLIALAGLAVAVVLVRARSWEHMQEAGDPLHAEQILASIISSASSNPRLWRHAAQLWSHRILPTVGGARISVLEARRLAGRRRLFLGRRRNRLVRQAARAGSVVLDRDSEAFGHFLGRLPGVIDLDSIHDLRAAMPRGDDVLDRLLGRVNGILAAAGERRVRVLRAPGLTSDVFRDVDLSTLRHPRDHRWPRSFVAVNPTAGLLRSLTDLHGRSPRLAAYGLIDALSRESLLLTRGGERLRYRAAALLLEEEQ